MTKDDLPSFRSTEWLQLARGWTAVIKSTPGVTPDDIARIWRDGVRIDGVEYTVHRLEHHATFSPWDEISITIEGEPNREPR